MQTLYRLLGFDPTKHNLRTELMAGLTTFLTMSYILAVNPDILSSTGMDKGAVFTATALASALGTVLIAFLAKLPFAQAPGMGINAFFAFTLVAGMGYSWQTALAAVFVEGIIFILLTAFNVREQIVHCIPKTLRFAISAGIGFFIAFIGLKILLSAKLQNDTISLSATPINRRCGFLFRKVSPLSQRVKVRRVDYRGYPRPSTNLFRDARRNCSSQCST